MSPTGRAVVSVLAAAGVLSAALGTITAMPATVTFVSSDPDQGLISGSPVTVTWRFTGGQQKRDWNIAVRADSSTLANCNTVPASAITVSCQAVSITGDGPGGSGSCSQPFQLGTANRQLAGGLQRQHNANYTVNITYSFQDSWRYRGAVTPACALVLTYTVYFQ